MITPAEAQPILDDLEDIRKITRSPRIYALLLHAETEVTALVAVAPPPTTTTTVAAPLSFGRLFGLGGRVP